MSSSLFFRTYKHEQLQDELFQDIVSGCRDPSTCGMNKCELITKHAIGQVFISRNGDVQIKKVRKFASSIMDMNEKSKYKQYMKFVGTLNSGKKPQKLETPNDTRVSGAMMMYETMLRSY